MESVLKWIIHKKKKKKSLLSYKRKEKKRKEKKSSYFLVRSIYISIQVLFDYDTPIKRRWVKCGLLSLEHGKI